jgi:phosphoenolpyruvate carboxylase
MIYLELQVALELDKLDRHEIIGKEFECKLEGQKQSYIIKELSNKRHLIPSGLPIGVIMTGFTQQYKIVDNLTNEESEMYAYFYVSMEGNKFAIIDALEVL